MATQPQQRNVPHLTPTWLKAELIHLTFSLITHRMENARNSCNDEPPLWIWDRASDLTYFAQCPSCLPSLNWVHPIRRPYTRDHLRRLESEVTAIERWLNEIWCFVGNSDWEEEEQEWLLEVIGFWTETRDEIVRGMDEDGLLPSGWRPWMVGEVSDEEVCAIVREGGLADWDVERLGEEEFKWDSGVEDD